MADRDWGFNAAGGYPSGGFGKPDKDSGRTMQWSGIGETEEALVAAVLKLPKALRAALTELGLFGERETKLGTPVHFALLRASIGHFDDSVKIPPNAAPESPASNSARAKMEEAASHGAEMAVFEVDAKGKTTSVTWGTNVFYAPFIEDGFTMRKRRLVYIWNVGFRWVNPFSYRGAHMFENALERTVQIAPQVILHYVENAVLKTVNVSEYTRKDGKTIAAYSYTTEA